MQKSDVWTQQILFSGYVGFICSCLIDSRKKKKRKRKKREHAVKWKLSKIKCSIKLLYNPCLLYTVTSQIKHQVKIKTPARHHNCANAAFILEFGRLFT